MEYLSYLAVILGHWVSKLNSDPLSISASKDDFISTCHMFVTFDDEDIALNGWGCHVQVIEW